METQDYSTGFEEGTGNALMGGTLAEQDPNANESAGGILGTDGDEMLETPEKKFPAYILMLLGVIIAAGGVLFAMRQIGLGAGDAFAQPTVIEGWDPSQPREDTSEQDAEILDSLTADRSVSQVPVTLVQKNPFELAEELMPEEEEEVVEEDPKPRNRPGRDPEAERIRREKEERKRLVERTFDSLRINGIVGGSRPVARISGRNYRTGDVIEDLFVVRAIYGRAVQLEVDGETMILSMPDLTHPDRR